MTLLLIGAAFVCGTLAAWAVDHFDLLSSEKWNDEG